MPKYGKPIWQWVLEAAQEIGGIFAPSDAIEKIHEKNPQVPSTTIRCYVIGMAPNHPSSYHYPSTRRNHPYFEYLGDGRFRLLEGGKDVDYPEVDRKLQSQKFTRTVLPKPFSLINRSPEKVRIMKERVDDLNDNFIHYLDVFDDENVFSGPSLYFHYKTLDRAKLLGSVAKCLQDELYFDYLYATLASWGLHRMGKTGAKLNEIDVIKRTLKSASDTLLKLEKFNLIDLTEGDLLEVNARLKHLIEKITISASSTQLVSGSKALHHILPDLIPPIDRNYTIRFFYGKGGRKQVPLPYGGDGRIFREIFPVFHYIGHQNKESIQKLIGKKFHTSQTKVIDNAIIGYVIENLPY